MADRRGAPGAAGWRNPPGLPETVAGSFAAVGVGAIAWPFISSMNPARDVLALSTTDVDLTPIATGPRSPWSGAASRSSSAPHREESRRPAPSPLSELKDPPTDQSRVKKDQWLVIIGICTHLGCIPLGQKPTDPAGRMAAGSAPATAARIDTSGRIRQGRHR